MRAPALTVVGPDVRRVSIVGYPSDEAFVDDVAAAVVQQQGRWPSVDELRARVEADLRTRYPDLRLRARDELAGYDASEVVWYALRDGRIGPQDE